MLSNEHATPHSMQTLLTQTTDPVTTTSAVVLASADEEAQAKLDEAVDQVCAPLIGVVPRAHRLAKSRVLREELNTLVAAHSELETESEQAIDAAIAHFHRLHPVTNPHTSAQTVVVPQTRVTPVQTLQTTVEANREARPAMLLSLGLLSSFYLVHIYNGAERIRELLNLSESALYRWELFAVPLFVGLVVGLLMRRRAARGALFACGLLAAYAVLYPSLLMALGYAQWLPFESSNLYRHIVPDPIAGYSGLTVWPLLTCAGATLGAKLRTLKR